MKKHRINYTVIAKSVPEPTKDGVFTCSIGISPELGLIRVYPLPLNGMNKWETWNIEVEKNIRDSRESSWKLSTMARKEEWVGLSNDCKLIGYLDKESVYSYLSKLTFNSIDELNRQRKSIGVLKIEKGSFRADWVPNSKHVNKTVLPLFEDAGIEVEVGKNCNYTKHLHDKELRIKFKGADGMHDLQYNEWQFYEFQRRHGADKNILKQLNDDYDLLLLGNMLQHQNNWLGLGKFKTIYKNQLQLFK